MADQKYKARYVQDGNAIDHTPTSALAAGAVVVAGGFVGITHRPIAALELGALELTGCYEGAKDGSAFAKGDVVYWNPVGNPVGGTAGSGAFTSTAAAATFVGLAILASLAGDATVRFRLTQKAAP